jgi:2-polyprenyl-6-methoxyphenol hydroxylase-like FAD-dependent oxidoreductase
VGDYNRVILIIGGGIGGLTTAVALRRAGIEAEVYERAAELREVGAGLSLWRNALVALDRIGLGRAIRDHAVPYVNAGLRRSDGRLLVAASMDRLIAELGEVAVVLHRAVVQKVLADALGRDRIHLGKACTGIEQDASGVTATFADGSQVRGDGLIGADGMHSVIRAALHGQAPPRYSGYTAWRAVVPFDHARLTIGETWGRGSRFGQVPLADGQVYWFATNNTAEGQHAPDSEKAECERLFRGWHDPIPALVDVTPSSAIIRSDICDRPPLTSWSAGRVTLVGDAAHPMTPNLGQGACQAIEDAVVLAAVARESSGLASAWRTYESRRIRRTTEIARASKRLGDLAQWSNALAVRLRNALIPLVPPRVQEKQMAGVIGYEV